jgi:hypothetical protein
MTSPGSKGCPSAGEEASSGEAESAWTCASAELPSSGLEEASGEADRL